MEDLLSSGIGLLPGIGQTYEEDGDEYHPMTTANGATANHHAMPWLKHSKSCQETTDRPHSSMPMVRSTYFWDGSSSHEADLARGWWWPSHDHYQWWNLRISGIVFPVMKQTMQDNDGDFPQTSVWCANQGVRNIYPDLKCGCKDDYMPGKDVESICKFEMPYSVCICMSLLSHYHSGWNQKQWKKSKKTVKKSKIS